MDDRGQLGLSEDAPRTCLKNVPWSRLDRFRFGWGLTTPTLSEG